MKALALAVSARQHGNCYDFAAFTLEQLAQAGVETELINFNDYRITPCQGCNYECVQHTDPTRKADAVCPIDDDVQSIWEKVWKAEILFLFVPNYGGLPPALWFAFSQRVQGYHRLAPPDRAKKSVVSAVIIAPPHQSSGAPWVYSMMGDEVKGLERVVAGFEVISTPEFASEYTFTPLVECEEIQRRLRFLAETTLKKQNLLQERSVP